jgi:alpha-N-acetylglucosaminidase
MWTRRKFIGATCTGIGVAMSKELLATTHSTTSLDAEMQRSTTPSKQAVLSAGAVLQRLMGESAESFKLEWIPKENDRDVYEVAASRGQVSVKGSSGVAISRGAYAYLRETCQVMVTWSGRHLEMPASLPDFPLRRVVCPYRFTQYFNPCTFGYTMAFWDWARWERELDWMALHGINMPLAMEGQEAIWQKVWLSMGLSQEEVDKFSTGPAQLPWHRMGNINHFDGPLPQGWIGQKRILQRKILTRMRELGMTPIAPGFSGFVPQGFKRLHPSARTFTLLWLPDEFHTIPRATKTFILHPGESEFYKEIGRRFIQSYKAEYGEVSYYLADTFNEMTVPVSTDRRYEDLQAFGRTVYEGIKAGDPDGTWVMQSWLFVYDSKFWDSASIKALLAGVPDERLLIIDYANDLPTIPGSKYAPNQWKFHEAFFGKQWINGMAHTFGGNNNIKGNLALMTSQPAEVLHSSQRGNLVGWGICPEGIENNEVVYELMTDVGWSDKRIDLATWIPAYARARYGAFPPAMKEAWDLLLESAYSSHIWMTKQGWQAEPSLEPKAVAVDSGPRFQRATELFLACAEQLSSNEFYRHDLIELVAQSAGGSVDKQLAAAGAAHKAQQPEVRDKKVAESIQMLLRIDALMNLRPDRKLETWTAAAQSWGRSAGESVYYDENARRLITVWGWPELSDYASRVWAGLIRDYYAARWQAFFTGLKNNKPVSLDIWQETWLSSPYVASSPKQVTDLVSEAKSMLQQCKSWE